MEDIVGKTKGTKIDNVYIVNDGGETEVAIVLLLLFLVFFFFCKNRSHKNRY